MKIIKKGFIKLYGFKGLEVSGTQCPTGFSYKHRFSPGAGVL